MKIKLAFLLSLLTLLAPATLRADDPPQQRNSRSPILVAEINNNGDVRVVLTVYNDGEAILARKDTDEPDGEICSAIVPAAGLETLKSKLSEAGALHLEDAASDPSTSRKTISFFIGPAHGGRTVGNTFGYSRAEGPYLVVAQALGALIAENFGGCI
jgi:hypothetical protein